MAMKDSTTAGIADKPEPQCIPGDDPLENPGMTYVEAAPKGQGRQGLIMAMIECFWDIKWGDPDGLVRCLMGPAAAKLGIGQAEFYEISDALLAYSEAVDFPGHMPTSIPPELSHLLIDHRIIGTGKKAVKAAELDASLEAAWGDD
jgi:hypothetical protein